MTSDNLAEEKNIKYVTEVVGIGHSSDAKHITAGCENGIGIRKAILKAIMSAEINANDIDLIKAHGTGTEVNDKNEARVLSDIFLNTPVVSMKGQFGHSAASCGVFELIICELMIKKQVIYSTKNSEDFDTGLGINLINRNSIKTKLDLVLMNAFGFGGNNSSLILRRNPNK